MFREYVPCLLNRTRGVHTVGTKLDCKLTLPSHIFFQGFFFSRYLSCILVNDHRDSHFNRRRGGNQKSVQVTQGFEDLAGRPEESHKRGRGNDHVPANKPPRSSSLWKTRHPQRQYARPLLSINTPSSLIAGIRIVARRSCDKRGCWCWSLIKSSVFSFQAEYEINVSTADVRTGENRGCLFFG